jgi:hypothetical protein
MISLTINRGGKHGKVFSSVLGAFAALTAVAGAAYSHDVWEPIGVAIGGQVRPGMTVPVTVSMTGGPAPITIYSNPPGVYYQGILPAATGTVNASVSPNLNASQVTIYVQSEDSSQVVSTTADIADSDFEEVEPAERPIAGW